MIVLITICVISLQPSSLLWTLPPIPLGARRPDQRIHFAGRRSLAPDSLRLREYGYPPTVIVEGLWEGSALQGTSLVSPSDYATTRSWLSYQAPVMPDVCVCVCTTGVWLSRIMATDKFTAMICNDLKRKIISAARRGD